MLKIFKYYFYFQGNVLLQQDNRQTPHSPVAINLPKYSPDIGLLEKQCLENSPWLGANVFLALSLFVCPN